MKIEKVKELLNNGLKEGKFTDESIASIHKEINEFADSVRDNHFEAKKEEIKSTLSSEIRSQLFKEVEFDSEDEFKKAKEIYKSNDNELTAKLKELEEQANEFKTKYETTENSLNKANNSIFEYEQKTEINKTFNSERVDDVFDLAKVRKTDDTKYEDIYKNILEKNPSWAKEYKGRNYTPPGVNNQNQQEEGKERKTRWNR